MTSTAQVTQDPRRIRILTYLMFMMFAMTTDSVGVIIPHVIKTFELGMAAAGSFPRRPRRPLSHWRRWRRRQPGNGAGPPTLTF